MFENLTGIFGLEINETKTWQPNKITVTDKKVWQLHDNTKMSLADLTYSKLVLAEKIIHVISSFIFENYL